MLTLSDDPPLSLLVAKYVVLDENRGKSRIAAHPLKQNVDFRGKRDGR